MNTKSLVILALTSAFSLQPSALVSAAPIGTAFTYQGRLQQSGGPASGLYDFQYSLWDADTAGTPVGSVQAASAVGVTNGLFTVTLDFGSVFNGSARWLEIGVCTNGGSAFTALVPRQQLTATPYAVTAGAVSGPIDGGAIVNGSITSAQLASGAVTAANIASNSVTAGQLAAGAAAANLNAASQSGVASGGLVMSLTDNNSALVNAGYVRIGMTATPDVWLPLDNGPIPAARQNHTVVWTGSEMIIWGGQKGSGSGNLNDGWRYNLASHSWTAVTTNGAPAARYSHTAVWTGSEMIIWGGYSSSGNLNNGRRYNPLSDSWTAVTTNSAPTARSGHIAVWSGSEMIVWGGAETGPGGWPTGGRYDPTGDSWTEVTTNNTILPRTGPTAVWTGSEMIVWGGETYMDEGARYNPSSNIWTRMLNLPNTPAGRYGHTAVWTGSEMLIWGGVNQSVTYSDGGYYNPVTHSWRTFPSSLPNTPAARYAHTAVWTGSEMIVWGGVISGGLLTSGGARYNPVADRWMTVSTVGAPIARQKHKAVWTGNEMIVSGGTAGSSPLGDTFSYMLGRVMYLYQRP